ncbi:adenine phosphoribosyltransferase [Acinetobacter sp.]|uniref:adenine phosphoribosyltransferase n=1 Tax=Acinetobacter sp. TaxID=472 RepID=UPI0031D2354D
MNFAQTFWTHIRTVPNFPKAGICFYDLTPLLVNHIQELSEALVASIPAEKIEEVDSFVAVEARGFVLASFLAQRLNKGLILVRKAGKLPPPVVGVGYSLEYGLDQLEMSADLKSQNVILVDDVLATGGTLKAVQILAKKCHLNVLGATILLDLDSEHKDIGLDVWSVVKESQKPEHDAVA